MIFRKRKFKFFAQHDAMDCAPTCLKMIANYYGETHSLEYLRDLCNMNHEGVSLLSLGEAGKQIGFETVPVTITLTKLASDIQLPCILHWNQEHYVVLKEIKTTSFLGINKQLIFSIADPSHGEVNLDYKSFISMWSGLDSSNHKGIALLFNKGNTIDRSSSKEKNKKITNSFLYKYLKPHSGLFTQILIGMIFSSIVTLLFPFLTQILVDFGIKGKKIDIIYLVLLSQLFFFIGSASIDLIQNRILLHINIRVSIHIISDFLSKLFKLPIKYFDTKSIGDISQRINDHKRIEKFLTSSVLNSLFSFFKIILFSVILGFYSFNILSIFMILSLVAILWILLFSKKREELDYKIFNINKINQSKMHEMIFGMQEIKLFGGEEYKINQWNELQSKIFNLTIAGLTLEQYQRGGFIFISQLKNILISFLAAKEVLSGQLTLGVLLSISYIIGQTNGPLEELVAFIKSSQDARLSMERMLEVHESKNEDDLVETHHESLFSNENKILYSDISLNSVSYQFDGVHSPFVLKNVNLIIPKGKVTAIVGPSGSGKTTLMKLLLGFYEPTHGNISIGSTPLRSISPSRWRTVCGTVMQDGYLFSDTITRNIVLDGKEIEVNKIKNAVKTANIEEFIQNLPLKYLTKIGNEGVGLSGGQKQRILIARAVYKDPSYLFLDEATSALDANNESLIIDNLSSFFEGRTVVVIAHRLSTVKNADNIIVIDKGSIIEEGNHFELCNRKGFYYNLVKNQLELEAQ